MITTDKVSLIFIYKKQNNQGKKDEFTKYLEQEGTVESLTEALMSLYEESEAFGWPKFPTDYIKANLKSTSENDNEKIIQNDKLREENKLLKKRIIELERNIERVKRQIEEKQG